MSVFVTQNTRHYFVLPFQHFHPVLLFTIHQTHKRVLAAISHIATYRMPLSTSLCRVKLTQITATKLRGTMAQVVGSDFLPLCRMLLPVFSFSFHTSRLSRRKARFTRSASREKRKVMQKASAPSTHWHESSAQSHRQRCRPDPREQSKKKKEKPAQHFRHEHIS